MKKVIAILVAVMLMATVCMTASASSCTMAFAAVEVEEGTTTVAVPLNITANDGIWSFIVEASYDTSKLEFTGADSGEGFELLANEATAGTVRLAVNGKGTDNVTTTGVAAVLNFNVKGVAGDVADITASLPDAGSNINADFEDVDVTVANGSVKVIEKATKAPETTKTPDTTKATEATDAPETTAAPTTAAPTDAPVAPATGSVIPAAAIVLATASAAVLTFARKK